MSAVKTIGIIGGGQLGLMIIEQAHLLGARTICLDPAEDAPAFKISDERIVGRFDDPEALLEHSVSLAKHLYESGMHPQIKGGEFYTAYFSDCNFGGERCDALGLFKSETREKFLDVEQQAGGVHIAAREGFDI